MLKKEVLLLLGGAFAAVATEKMLATKKARKAAVNAMSYAIRTKEKVREGYENIKEDAQDMVYEAKKRAREAERFEVKAEAAEE